MSDGHSLVIHILDKEYRVACPPGEQDNLLRAARYLDNQMREVRQANVIGLERIAIAERVARVASTFERGGDVGRQRLSGSFEHWAARDNYCSILAL